MTNTTLKQISEVLGLSISTISRALKNHPDISEKTKKKVLELAEVLDYEPNTSAIQLRTKHSKLFGIMVPSISNFFYDSFISAVEKESHKEGYSVMILQSGDNINIENENLKLCRQNRITGLFACMNDNSDEISKYLKLQEHGIKVVFFDKVPENDNIIKICMEDAKAGQFAADEILKAKKKKILAIFGNPKLSITQKRETAFCNSLLKRQKNIMLTVEHASSSDHSNQLVNKFLKQGKDFDTVFCMSDEILIGTMKALQQLNLSIPKDISVISISNGFIPTLYYPTITYIETSGYKLGELAFNHMMKSLTGKEIELEEMVQAKLIPGGSL